MTSHRGGSLTGAGIPSGSPDQSAPVALSRGVVMVGLLFILGTLSLGLVLSGVVIAALRQLPGYLDRREWARYVADVQRDLVP